MGSPAWSKVGRRRTLSARRVSKGFAGEGAHGRRLAKGDPIGSPILLQHYSSEK